MNRTRNGHPKLAENDANGTETLNQPPRSHRAGAVGHLHQEEGELLPDGPWPTPGTDPLDAPPVGLSPEGNSD